MRCTTREWLIERIIFLEGMPVVLQLNPIKIGLTVLEIVSNDQEDELGAIRADKNRHWPGP